MAFQPIADVEAERVWAYEALVRGPDGQGAGWVLDQVTEANRYAFDQACRIKAIERAAELFPKTDRPILSINFLPNAVYMPAACIRTTLETADRTQFPVDKIMLEITEGEKIEDIDHVRTIIREYQKRSLITAIDDFGAGFAGLGLLADFQPDVIKIDMGLIRSLDSDRGRHAIVRGIIATARQMGITVVAEGIETEAEFTALRDMGITLMQGFLFAKPAIEALPEPYFPKPASASQKASG
ncbi:MAG: EAL domain-containing protein [Parvularcula sp.]|jgi:EAL domain-containing protein (putative c-di-GMP-specific phosphodiesterase class I)|nr:EAL domain-containing protein [Parvularcula sp.]